MFAIVSKFCEHVKEKTESMTIQPTLSGTPPSPLTMSKLNTKLAPIRKTTSMGATGLWKLLDRLEQIILWDLCWGVFYSGGREFEFVFDTLLTSVKNLATTTVRFIIHGQRE